MTLSFKLEATKKCLKTTPLGRWRDKCLSCTQVQGFTMWRKPQQEQQAGTYIHTRGNGYCKDKAPVARPARNRRETPRAFSQASRLVVVFRSFSKNAE